MIAIDHLSKRFDTHRALDDVTLALAPGRVTALLGPNGAGKSTLIKAILGLCRPDAGSLLVDGVPADEAGRYRARIGYMPQAAAFPSQLTGADVLALLAGLRGDVPRDDELVLALGLPLELGKRIGTLSGGTRQKLNAACAFLFRPDVLILDEPTAGLDPVAAGVLKEKVRRERDAGRTVLITSHVLSELEELADDVAFLLEGRLAFTGPVTALLAQTGQRRLERAVAAIMTREAA